MAVCGYLDAVHRFVETQTSRPDEKIRSDTESRKDADTAPQQVTSHGLRVTNSESRTRIIRIASAEIGVREATGNNDGKRVEEYLRYTALGKGHAWCAAFISWCYGQAGISQPRNPWSPALFPNSRTYCRGDACRRPNTVALINSADVFGIYGQSAKRINHVGLVKDIQGQYVVTIEGNSNDRVESRRRHLSTIYALSNWLPADFN